MKQKYNSHNCTAVVAAMITNTTPKLFRKFVGGNPPYGLLDLYRYLLEHDFTIGVGANRPFGVTNSTDIIIIKINVRDPAIVGVKSENIEGVTHLIYWDGTSVHDPNPRTKDGRPLESYYIMDWYPVHRIID